MSLGFQMMQQPIPARCRTVHQPVWAICFDLCLVPEFDRGRCFPTEPVQMVYRLFRRLAGQVVIGVDWISILSATSSQEF